jgi:hypothetical protein
LQARQTGSFGYFLSLLKIPKCENTNFFYIIGQCGGYVPRFLWVNFPRASLVKYETQGVGARIDGGLRVFHVRNPTNLDPGH